MRGVKTDAGGDGKLKFSFPWPWMKTDLNSSISSLFLVLVIFTPKDHFWYIIGGDACPET